MWNYNKFDGPRTNNGLEGWHHRLNSNIATCTTNVYVVIDESRKDYALNMATLKQVEQNISKPPRNKRFIYRNHRVQDLMKRYERGSLSLNGYFIKMSQTIGAKTA